MEWIDKKQASSQSNVSISLVEGYIKRNYTNPLLIKKENLSNQSPHIDKETGEARYNFKYLINSDDWFAKYPVQPPIQSPIKPSPEPPLEAKQGDREESRRGDREMIEILKEQIDFLRDKVQEDKKYFTEIIDVLIKNNSFLTAGKNYVGTKEQKEKSENSDSANQAE